MIIESLELKNYRNYKELHINFDPGDQCALWRQCPGKNQYPGICLCMRNDKITPGKQGQGDYRIRGGRIPY